MRDGLVVIDAQAHAWAPHSAAYPWDPLIAHTWAQDAGGYQQHFSAESAVTTEAMIAAMDAAGVTACVLVVPTLYGFDNRYALDAAGLHPSRFAVVGRIDPTSPSMCEEVAAWKEEPAGVGLRITVVKPEDENALLGGRYDAFFASAQQQEVPVCILARGCVPLVEMVARKYPTLRIVLDHAGLPQPPMSPLQEPRFKLLPPVLDLAAYPNISVKISGLPTLSAEGYPFNDVWPALEQLFEAFGLERLMWGTDWTRTRSMLSYSENVTYISQSARLTWHEKQPLFAGSLQNVFGWDPRHTDCLD